MTDKCEICGKPLKNGLFNYPAKSPRWCEDCIEAGLCWGMERYAEAKERERHA